MEFVLGVLLPRATCALRALTPPQGSPFSDGNLATYLAQHEFELLFTRQIHDS